MMMKKILKMCLLILGACWLSSCSMIPMMFPPDLSRQKPYKPYIGKTVYLKDGKPLWIGAGSYNDYPHLIAPFDPQGSGTLDKIPLKKGQPFILEKARHQVGAGVSVVVLLGRVEVGGKEYKVEVSGGNYEHRHKKELPFTENRP